MLKIFKSGAKIAAAGMLVMSLAGGAMAQDATQQPERKPEDNWLKVCDKLSSGELACIVRQVVFQGGNKIGAFTLRDDPSGKNRYLAIAEMPLAVLLPFGLTWQVDNTKPIRMPFVTCDPTKCTGQLVVNEAFIGALKRGAKLKLSAKNRANKDLVVDVNLSGFTAVYEGDNFYTPAEFQAQSSGQNALEQQLQGVAEELRKEKAGEGNGQPAANSGN